MIVNSEIVKQHEYYYHMCPYCHKRLDMFEYIKRKVLKVCKCYKCGGVINDKYITYYKM